MTILHIYVKQFIEQDRFVRPVSRCQPDMFTAVELLARHHFMEAVCVVGVPEFAGGGHNEWAIVGASATNDTNGYVAASCPLPALDRHVSWYLVVHDQRYCFVSGKASPQTAAEHLHIGRPPETVLTGAGWVPQPHKDYELHRLVKFE